MLRIHFVFLKRRNKISKWYNKAAIVKLSKCISRAGDKFLNVTGSCKLPFSCFQKYRMETQNNPFVSETEVQISISMKTF